MGRGLPEQPLIAGRRQVHIVLDIVLHNVVHPDLHPAVLVDGDGIAHLHPQQLGQLFRQDRPVPGRGDAPAALPVAQVHELGEALEIVNGVQPHVVGHPPGGRLRRRLAGEVPPLHHAAAVQVVQPRRGVVEGDLVELLVEYGEDGLMKPEAGDDEGGTAPDADDCHPEPPLIAEQVAHGHLPGEGQPVPHKPHPLQQNPPPRLGGLGAHKVGRGSHQRGQAGPQRGPGGARHRRQHRQHAQGVLLPELQGRHGVHDAEGVGHHRRDQGGSHPQPNDAAQQAG